MVILKLKFLAVDYKEQILLFRKTFVKNIRFLNELGLFRCASFFLLFRDGGGFWLLRACFTYVNGHQYFTRRWFKSGHMVLHPATVDDSHCHRNMDCHGHCQRGNPSARIEMSDGIVHSGKLTQGKVALLKSSGNLLLLSLHGKLFVPYRYRDPGVGL